MFRKIKRAREIVRDILSKRNYFIIFLITSLVGFVVLYKLTLATTAKKSLNIFIMMQGSIYVFVDLFVLLLISLLFGIYVSLFVYRVKIIRAVSKTGFFGSLGLIVGLFSAGCPTCGAVLFSLIGMPLALMSFPFHGLELKVLSIILLSVSVYIVARSFVGCEVDKNRLKSVK